MADTKEAHAIVSYFVKKFKEAYNAKAPVNRYAARWGAESILEDFTLDEAKSLVDYYFETSGPHGHSWDFFLYNYDKLEEAREAVERDRAELARVRAESKARAEAWKEKNGSND